MTDLTIGVSAYSVQAAKPNLSYGQISRLPVRNGESVIPFRAALHRIPAGATVVSAVVEFTEFSDEGGSRTLRVKPATEAWNSNVTWANKPTTGSEADVITKAAPQLGDVWAFDVAAEVQQVVSGQRVDFGWQLAADAAVSNTLILKGSPAATGAPRLVVNYTMTPLAPENLHPASGAVSVDKPVLTFDADDSILALQVQIDAAMDEVTPDFDSGTVAAAGGYLDLSGTAYAGLAAGATTSWRARQQTAGGWSDWSAWVDFSRESKPTLTITSPASTLDDGTPPITWTFAGTQTAWQVRLLDEHGDVVADSGYTPGTDTTWTPNRGLTRDGQEGTIELLVWDDSERVAVAGDPEYVMVTQAVTLTLDGTVTAVTTLNATQVSSVPDVILTGTRASVPDEVDVFRKGDLIARYVGTDVFTGTSFTITDALPPMNKPLTYRVAPRVDGKTASGGPTATITPHATKIWLADLESPDDRVFFAGPTPEQAQPETAAVHTPLREVSGAGQVIRRRLVRYRPQGSVAGRITDIGAPPGSLTAAEREALLRDWADFDSGHPFRLVFSGFDGDVIIGDLTFTEIDNPNQESRRILDVSFNYWGQAAGQ